MNLKISFARRSKAWLIGNKRPPSPLDGVQPESWPAEYTSELLNVLNVLGRLVKLEDRQAALLEDICFGETLPADELVAAGAFNDSETPGEATGQTRLLD